MQQYGSKIIYLWTPDPPAPSPGGQKVKIQFLEHGHVAYQIKGNDTCSNMAANIFIPYPLTTLQLFQKIVMFHIKLKWNRECSNMQAHILSLHTHTHSSPGVRSKVETFFF